MSLINWNPIQYNIVVNNYKANSLSEIRHKKICIKVRQCACAVAVVLLSQGGGESHKKK